MYRLSRLKYVFPIGLFVSLFLDGSLSHVFAPVLFNYPYFAMSELVLLWIVLAYFFQDNIKIPLIPFSIAAGVVIDFYSTGILGLYVILLPCIVMLTRLIAGYYPKNYAWIMAVFFIDIVVFMLVNYFALSLIGIINQGFGEFLLNSLAPTLALNLVYFVLLYPPIHAMYIWATSEKRS
ncbi:MAG: rod shape-determining protein MreD [Limosilactobacillus sp.]|uniref:rod shape-determining protein MreD n=1 Tax=Limosilactobacillus sp. TaxID=2773925 RepID=UPI0026F6F2DA|nr:rod shape-determining protein MreD [Limosilactobacillus sp.]